MTENELKNLLAAVTPPDEAARAAAHAHCRPFALAAVNASPFSVESQ